MEKKKLWSTLASIFLMFAGVAALFIFANLFVTLPESKSDYGFFDWVFFMVNFESGYGKSFLSGIENTLLISITGTVVGFIIGLLIAVVRTIPIKQNANPVAKGAKAVVDWILSAYVEIYRGTPMMVQAVIIYYGLAQAFNINLEPITAGLIIVSINTGAYMTEIARGGIESIDPGQFDAAHAIGMNHFKTMIRVVLPQTIRNILPATGNEFVINIKDTSVLNVIAVSELYYVTKTVKGVYYRTFEAFLISAIIYLFLTFTITRILRIIEMMMDGSSSYAMSPAKKKTEAAK